MKKIVLIVKLFSDENLKKEPYYSETPTEGLEEDKPLYNFITKKYRLPSIQSLINKDIFIEWFQTLEFDSVPKVTFPKFQYIIQIITSNDTQKIDIHKNDIKQYIKNNIRDYLDKFDMDFFKSDFFKFRKLENPKDKNTELILLPCYESYTSLLDYNPVQDKWELLEAIIKNFDLDDNKENEIFIHDKEWNNTKDYDYIDTGNDNTEIRKYFKGGINIFMHSDLSNYYTKIILPINFKEIKIRLAKENIIKKPNPKTISIEDLALLDNQELIKKVETSKEDEYLNLMHIAEIIEIIIHNKECLTSI